MVCLAAYTSCFIFNCWFSFNVWFTLTPRFYSWYDSLLLLIFYDWLIPAIYKSIRYAAFHCVYFNNGTLRPNIITLVFGTLFYLGFLQELDSLLYDGFFAYWFTCESVLIYLDNSFYLFGLLLQTIHLLSLFL